LLAGVWSLVSWKYSLFAFQRSAGHVPQRCCKEWSCFGATDDGCTIPDEEGAVNEEIRELFGEIEEDIRYRYVKYTSIYLQVLSLILKEKGETERAEKLLPLHTFLEVGASDRALIELMCLGLSRTSAILLKNTVSLHSDMTLQQCKRCLEALNLTRIAIPAICKAGDFPFAR